MIQIHPIQGPASWLLQDWRPVEHLSCLKTGLRGAGALREFRTIEALTEMKLLLGADPTEEGLRAGNGSDERKELGSKRDGCPQH